MALIGTREDWEALVRRNGAGAHLEYAHARVVQRALTAADGAAEVVVDALDVQTKQERETARKEPLRAEYAVCRADDVEAVWLDRAHALGLTSIRPVASWPRRPARRARQVAVMRAFREKQSGAGGSSSERSSRRLARYVDWPEAAADQLGRELPG
jgi:hypothetical protein